MSLSPEQRELVESAMREQRIPGVSVAVVKNGELISEEGFGFRDLARELPMTPRTVSPICSLTKSFTGIAVMQLVEEGVLYLDEPVSSYLRDFRLADESASRKITPRMLLSHKSGIGRSGHQSRMFTESKPYADRADLVSRLSEATLQTPPNSAWSYCNEGYVTLGYLVETLRGESLEEVFQNRIFDVVGLSETFTSFSEWRASEDRTLTYHTADDAFQETTLPEDYSIYLSTGGICSSARDIANYQIATMDYANCPLLASGSLEHMQTVSMPFGDTGWGWGLGWAISWSGGRKIVWHAGGLPGVATYSLMVPSEKLGVVVFANLSGAAVDLLAEQLAGSVLNEPLYRASVNEPLPLATRYELREPQLYEGVYSRRTGLANTEATVHGTAQQISIAVRDEDTGAVIESNCLAVGPDQFVSLSRGSVISFVRDGAGQSTALLIGGELYSRKPGSG